MCEEEKIALPNEEACGNQVSSLGKKTRERHHPRHDVWSQKFQHHAPSRKDHLTLLAVTDAWGPGLPVVTISQNTKKIPNASCDAKSLDNELVMKLNGLLANNVNFRI